MKKQLIRILSIIVLLTHAGISLAAVLPITVTFLGGTTNFSTNRQGTANYKVAVDPGVIPPNWSLTFSLASAGNSAGLTVSQITTVPSPCSGVSNGLCGSTFSLFAGQSCCLAFSLSSSAAGNYSLQPLIQTTPPAYSAQATSALSVNVTAAPGTTSLSSSVSTLALSVNNPLTNTHLTGQARRITISNTGSNIATGLTINYPSWPSGTTATSTCGSTLAAGATCTITITPGANTTSGCNNGSVPTPGSISINADNANTVTSNVAVLSYGCIYQGGYIYAVDDTTANTGSIGGKVVATTDQAPRFPNGVIWSSDSSGSFDGGISIWGIAETSTSANPTPNASSSPPATKYAGQSDCNGNSDGACDTNNIYIYYQDQATGHPINNSFYAAGRCKQTINAYSDWYLPATCEMGLTPITIGAGCAADTQNINDDLPALIGDPNSNPDTSCTLGHDCLSGYYWSSTAVSILNPVNAFAWLSQFVSGGGTTQDAGQKQIPAGVRCARVLTP